MRKGKGILYWAPRILCIFAILFISMFALDAFDHGDSLGKQLLAFLIHLIPSFILLAILLVAWKWEKVGGFIFILIGLIMSPLVFWHNYRLNESVWMSLGIIAVITIPFVIIGVLFILSYNRKRREESQFKE
jgi:cell division protein FtsW (lipid II flippase)